MGALTASQEQELHAELLRLRQELRTLLADSQQSSGIVDLEQPIGRLSRMEALQQQAMAKANRAGVEHRLKLIDAALLAFRQERFGECRRCEEPVGYQRLKVRPESPFCLDCQQQVEKES